MEKEIEMEREAIIIKKGGGGGAVDSVNGKTGDVVLTTSDLENTSDYQTGTEVEGAISEAIGALAPVATTGDYDDLAGKPTIGDATLTIQKNGTTVDTFTANATTNKTINITGLQTEITPTNKLASDLVDDTNQTNKFVTASEKTFWNGKQDQLTAGANITIEEDSGTGELEISATDTTYSDFTGTDGTAAGTAGLVPAPATTDAGKFLGASGLWEDVAGGGGVTELTTADYNWPTDNPTSVALWLLEPGYYVGPSDSTVNVRPIDSYVSRLGEGYACAVLVMHKTIDSNNRGSLVWFDGTTNNTKLYYDIDTNGANWFARNLDTSVTNSLTSTSTASALSANQGKVLKDLIDSLAIRGAGAPTVSTVGEVGQLYEDGTNGVLYQLKSIDITTTPNIYNWEEVGGGSSGGIIELTSADIDYPDANPTGIALWRLDNGTYYIADASLVGFANTANESSSLVNQGVCIIGDYGTASKSIVSFDVLSSKYWVFRTNKNTGAKGTATSISPSVVQTPGDSATDVMSQNAVTSMIFADPATQYKIKIGAGTSSSEGTDGVEIGRSASATGIRTLSVGYNSKATGGNAVALGPQAEARGNYSVAVGAAAYATVKGQFDIGNLLGDGYNNSNYRLLTGLYDPQSAHDAATKGYVDGKVLQNAGAPTTATVGTVGQLLEDTTNGKLYICTAVTPGTDPDPDTYTWVEVGAGGSITLYDTTLGDNTDGAPTQKAVRESLYYSGGNTYSSGSINIDPGETRLTKSMSNTRSIYIGTGATTITPGWPQQVAIGDGAKGSLSAVSIGLNAGPSAYAKGSHGVCIGPGASTSTNYTVSIGSGANTSANGSIALGANSSASSVGEMNIGSSDTSYGYNSTNYRLISGVHDGQGLHDAATLAQGNTLATAAPTTSTAGVLGQLYTDTTTLHTYQLTAIDTTDPQNPSYSWTQRW